jgi:HEAT repeat protein
MTSEFDNVDPGRALQAAVAHAQTGDFTGLEAIVRALAHDDKEIRLEAAYCCKRIGFSAALEPLCRMAHTDLASENRAQAIYALGGIGYPSAVPAIIRGLDDDEDECRTAARTVLYRMLGHEILPFLGDEGDERDPAEMVRVAELWAKRAHHFDTTRAYAIGELAGPGVFIARLKTTATALPDAYLNLLRDWTGEDFGTSPLPQVIVNWESWWARNALQYEAGRRYFYGHPVP